MWIKGNVYHELPRHQIEEKALWPLKEGILEEDQTDLNTKEHIRWFAPVAERKLGRSFHRLSANRFSVSIAIKNKEVISQVFLR